MKDQQTGNADYSYWLMVRMWSSKEAAALLLGYEPDYADFYYFDPHDHDPQELLHRKEIRNEWEKLEKILESAQLAGELGKVELTTVGKPWGKTVTSIQWINWAQQNDIDCATELLDALEEARVDDFGVSEEPQRNRPSDKRKQEGLQAAIEILQQKNANGELNDWQDLERCMKKAEIITLIRANPADYPYCNKIKPKPSNDKAQTIKDREPTLTKSFSDFRKDPTILAEYERLTNSD